VAYAENFHEGGSSSGVCWSFVFGVTSQFDVMFMFPNVLAKFVNIICIFFYTHSVFCVIALNIKLSTLQVRISEETKLNAMTQQLITAKISGCASKNRGVKHTHHYVAEQFTTAK